jgi:hypothetical protein
VQLGTVVEIGVRFPAILQHPVLQWKTNLVGLDTASKTVGLYKGCGSIPPSSAKHASADGAVPGLLNQVMGVRISPEAPYKKTH